MTGVSGPTSQPPAVGDGGSIDTKIYDGQIAEKERQLSSAEAGLKSLESLLANLKDRNDGLRGGWCFWGRHLDGEIRSVERQISSAKQNISNIKDALSGLREDKGDLLNVAEQARKDGTTLGDLLKNGDIEGAIMMVQTRRTETLDKQIEVRIRELQERNNKIASLNTQLSNVGKDDNKTKTRLKGEIDKLNADSQLDMIKMQSLTNKRNQAFETLTNLLQKFQKSLDAVVSNMR